MADTKRNSVAGRVATPKTPGSSAAATQPAGDQMKALVKAIGARVKVTTTSPHTQTYEGTLFTACPILNLVAINTRTSGTESTSDASTQPGDYHLIPAGQIQSFQILEPNAGAVAALLPVGQADLKRGRDRERARIAQLKDEEESRGKGVTKEAQAIFDSLKRINMPVRWHNQEMIVHEAVIIAPPYRVDDCKGPKDKQETLNRVRKVLEGERRKLKEREDRERKATATPVPRKGG